MILGAGTDIVEIKRFKEALKKAPDIIGRLFTEKEQKKAQKMLPSKKINYFAKRFAAKEAFSKACGTGIGRNIGWKDIEILNNKAGAPVTTFSEKADLFLQKKFKTKKIHIYLSLTDEKKYAMAFVILTK